MGQTVVEQLMVELKARTDQAETRLAAVEKQLDRTAKKGAEAGAAAGQLGGKYAAAGQQIASAAENMARSGQISGEAAKQMVQQGASMAMMFGVGGPIVGAVAIAGLAIFEVFDRTRKEMEATRRKAEEELNALARNRDVGGLALRAQKLYEGDPFARPDLAEDEAERWRRTVQEKGITGARATIAEMRAQLARGDFGERGMRQVTSASGAGGFVQDVKRAREELQAEIDKWGKELQQLETMHDKTEKVLFGDSSAAAGSRQALGASGAALREEQNRRKIEADQKAADDRKKAGEKAASQAEREAAQAAERTKKTVESWFKELSGGIQQVQNAMLAATATMLDDMRASIERTESDLRKMGVPPSLIAQWRETAEAGFRAQTAAEMVAEAFKEIGSPTTIDGLGAGVERLQAMERVLISARDAEKEGSVARAAIEKNLATVTEKRVQLTQQLGRATLATVLPSKQDAEAAERAKRAREEAAKHAAELATQVAMVARGALAAAAAFGTMSDATRSALNDVINLGEGVARVIANPGDVGGWAQGIGSLASLASGAFGMSARDMEERANREANAAVVRGLRELAGALEEAVSALQDLSGIKFTAIQNAVDMINSQFTDVSGRKNILEVDRAFTAAGVSLDDAKAAADALGIMLDGTVDSYRKLGAALAEVRGKLTEFGASLSERRAELTLARKAYQREESPGGNVADLVFLAGQTSPKLWQRLTEGFSNGINSSADVTLESVSRLRQNAQELFEVIKRGGDSLDPSLLGGMSPEEFRAYLSEYFDALADVETSFKAAAARAQAEARAARASAVADAIAEDELYDRMGPGERLGTLTRSYAEQIPILERITKGLDLATEDGLRQFDERLREFYEGVRDGSIVVEGFTAEELVEAILGMEAAGDAAADSIRSATESLRAYTRALNDDLDVREKLVGGDKAGGSLIQFQQGQQQELDEAIAKGVDEGTLERLKRVQKQELDAFLAELAASAAAEATGGRQGPTSVVARAGAASIDTLIGIANSTLALDRERNVLLGSITRILTSGALPVITPPHVPMRGGGGQGNAYVTNNFYGPVTGAEEIRAATGQGGRDIARGLQQEVDRQRRVEGRAEVL